MLHSLQLIREYFDGPDGALYEDDLVEHFGREEVSGAIRAGILNHRWVPCGQGRHRCVCWPSEQIKTV